MLWTAIGAAVVAPASEAPAVAEVVVTGAPFAISIDSSTTSVDLLTRQQPDTAVPAGLGDVLSGLPGLRSTFHGPGASRPVIRGLSGPRVLILQNGVGLVDASSLSPDHAVASDPGEASRIEVLRGPSTLAYGGSAIGGVVNILDERVPSKPAQDGLDGRVSASGASVDDSRALAGGLKAGSGPWVFSLDGVTRRSGDYDTPLGRVANSWVTAKSYGAGGSYVRDDGFFGASVKRTESRYGVPGGDDAEGPVYIDLEQTRYDVRGEREVAWGPVERVRLAIGRADYRHAEIGVATGEVGTTFVSEGTEGRLELIQTERAGWEGAFGVQGLGRDLQAIGDEAFVPPVEIGEAGVFAFQRLDRDRWGLEGGLRLDRRRLRARLDGRPTSEAASQYGLDWGGADARPRFDNVSVSAAAFFRPAAKWFASLSVARNRRAPTEFELFADGPHAGTGAYEIGDPELSAETVTSFEATLHWTGSRSRLDLHAYASRFDDFIDQVPTGERVDETGAFSVDGLPIYRFVQTDARFVGAEVEGSLEVWRSGERSLSLEGSADVVRASTDGGPPARIPPWSATARAAWRSERLSAELELRRVGAQDRVAAFETPTAGFTLVNAKAEFKPDAERPLRLFVEGRNLTDEVAREHASFLKATAPLPGRSLRAGVAVSF